MLGWHHRLNGHEFEQTPGDMEDRDAWCAAVHCKELVSNGSPLQYSCLENPMDGGAWWAAVHGVSKLSDFTFSFLFHALEKEMAIHSSVLAWRIRDGGAWWAAIYGVAQSQT